MHDDFSALDLSPALQTVVADLGFARPTPVQIASIPVLLAGRDLIGQSKTGSGKTAAFVLPILERVVLESRQVQALVICPTRELSAQVARVFRELGRGHAGLAVIELTGGRPARPQRDALAHGAHVAVGTPGRLMDLLDGGSLDASELRTLVIDEADRMLDMGFGPDVEAIVRMLPGERQTALFSATFPDQIEAMSRAVQRNAERVTIDDAPGLDAPIRQLCVATAPEDRLHALVWALHAHAHESALIFCNFKTTVDELTTTLAAAGLSVDRLDGDLDQFHREQVLARFRNHSVRYLVATDVAGRGLDVKELDLVVNFELPQQPEIYLHRIGRTGRAGMTGVAVSLTTVGREARIRAIEELTGAAIEPVAFDPQNVPGQDALLRLLRGVASMQTILISGGRKDKVRPGDILGALTGEAGGLRGGDVGKIEVQERLSYVAVERSAARAAVERLNRGRIKGKRFRATLVGIGGRRDGDSR